MIVMPQNSNRCKYNVWDADVHGCTYIGCVHPSRDKLSGKLSNFFVHLFRKHHFCAAASPMYQKYCPYFEYLSIPSDELITLVQNDFKKKKV